MVATTLIAETSNRRTRPRRRPRGPLPKRIAVGGGKGLLVTLFILGALFPLAWVAYSLVRGALIDWYPYPFLNPAQQAGYGGVAVYVIAIASFILLVGAGVLALSRAPWPHEAVVASAGGRDVPHAREEPVTTG